MNRGSLRRTLLAPVVVLTAGACFATRADVQVLQMDLATVRADIKTSNAAMLAADSSLHRSLDSALNGLSANLSLVLDTVRAMHVTTMRLRGDVREDLQAIRQQLISVQELTGQSQRRIQELRADLEADAIERATPTPATRDTTRPPTGASPSTAPVGPAQLYQLAQDQLRRGSTGSARAAFTELLTQHPRSDLAADALYGVAETFASEGNGKSADSVYALVVDRFPASERAPTALYKRATALRAVGRADDARVLYRMIIDKYPRSDAAVLAEGFLGPRRP